MNALHVMDRYWKEVAGEYMKDDLKVKYRYDKMSQGCAEYLNHGSLMHPLNPNTQVAPSFRATFNLIYSCLSSFTLVCV